MMHAKPAAPTTVPTERTDRTIFDAHADVAEMPTYHVTMYGLHVQSALELSEWPNRPAGEPDLVIEQEPYGAPGFDGAPYAARTTFVDGDVQVEVLGVARYRAVAGSQISVAPHPDAKPEDVRLYLTGALLGATMHQRGIFPLHASCVDIDGTAAAFAAPSGEGKSTLVAALLRRGARFVSDDICVMSPVQSDESRVWPGATRVKLDANGMAAMDGSPAGLEPAGGNRGKYHVPVATEHALSAPIPLRRVYLLGSGEGAPRFERLSGLDAISALVDETYFLGYAVALGRSSQIFRMAAELSRTLTVSRLIRPRGFEHLEATLDLIERDVRSA
jgi:hypothetical protein